MVRRTGGKGSRKGRHMEPSIPAPIPRAPSRYKPHPGFKHDLSHPIAQLGGARFCRDCGLSAVAISREARQSKKNLKI